MPKKKQPQYEDALGSIYDFIFTEAKKKPAKVKPVKITGIDATNEFTNAIAATLENPLLFVNQTTTDAIDSVINYDLLRVRYGKGEVDNIKFNIKDLPKAIKDPNGFLDKSFEKLEAANKISRASWAGSTMMSLLAMGWAKRNGLDSDTSRAMAILGKGSDRSKQTTNFKPTLTADLAGRNMQLMDKHLGAGSTTLTQADFYARYGRNRKAEDMFRKYDKVWKKKYTDTNGDHRANVDSIAFDEELFTFLEGQELNEKAINSTDPEKSENYLRARRFLDSVQDSRERAQFRADGASEVRRYKREIERLKNSRDPNRNDNIRILNKRIKKINASITDSAAYGFAAQYGKWSGIYGSTKSSWDYAKGGLLPALITGDFFDPNKNDSWILPTDASAVKDYKSIYDSIRSRGAISNEDILKELNQLGKLSNGVKFKIPKMSNKEMVNIYNQNMMKLYYASPITWIKSLVNGEAFAYRAHQNILSIQKSMGAAIPGFDVTKLLGADCLGDDIYLDFLSSSATDEQMEQLRKFLSKNERLSKLAYNFSGIKRLQDKVSGLLEKKAFVNFRRSIGEKLLASRFFADKSAISMINNWILKGGIQTLMKGISLAVSSTLGPVAGLVESIIASKIMELGMKIAKPVIKTSVQILIFGMAGLLGIFVLLSFKTISLLGVFSHLSPTEVVKCQSASGTSPIIEDEDGDGINDYEEKDSDGDGIDDSEDKDDDNDGINDSEDEDDDGDGINDSEDNDDDLEPVPEFAGGTLPPGQTCLLSYTSATCSQGMYSSYSHKNTPAIDLAVGGYFYAPAFCGQGNCTVTYYGPVRCSAGYAGGMVKFKAVYGGNTYEFKLLHVDTNLSVGDTLSAGQAVAHIMTHEQTGSACSSGMHLHLETKYNGQIADPREILSASPEKGGFGCSISACPK